MPPLDQKLLLLWTPSLCTAEPDGVLRLAILGGVDLVQVREKRATARELASLVARARAVADPLGVPVFVNDRVDVALASGAAGVHLGQEDLSIADARRLLPAGIAVGVSTHTLEQLDEAGAAGADLVGFGPMFPSETKPHEPAIGPSDLREALRRATCPLFAIGGLDAERIAAIGATRAAVSAAILRSSDPRAAAAALRGALRS